MEEEYHEKLNTLIIDSLIGGISMSNQNIKKSEKEVLRDRNWLRVYENHENGW